MTVGGKTVREPRDVAVRRWLVFVGFLLVIPEVDRAEAVGIELDGDQVAACVLTMVSSPDRQWCPSRLNRSTSAAHS